LTEVLKNIIDKNNSSPYVFASRTGKPFKDIVIAKEVENKLL
jgi:hypothetical protein